MTTTNKPAIDTTLPDFLKATNDKGVSLSAGPAPVVASGVKTEPKVTKVPAGKTAKQLAKDAIKVAKDAAKELVKTGTLKAAKPAKVKRADVSGATGTVIDPATGEGPKVSRSIVPMKFKAKYATHNGTCGDDMALELKAATTKLNADKREELDVEALWAIAAQNKLDVSKYVSLNNGQKRMNVGNKLRGLLKAGHDVTIGSGKTKRVFKAEDYPV